MSAYREPGRDVDRTEIERAKIHEAAETKRKLIAEREATKRKRISEAGPTIGLAMLALSVAVPIVVGTFGLKWMGAHAPERCIEAVEVIGYSSARRECEGGHIETNPLTDEKLLWRCVCSARVEDAGADR